MLDIPDDDPSRARREFIRQFFPDRVSPRRIPRDELIKFLKEHGMPLGELEEDTFHRILAIACTPHFIHQSRELLPERDGFKIETASSGFEAGIQAESFHPHVIIIDFDVGFSEAIMIVANLRKSTNYESSLIIGLANELFQSSPKVIANGFNEITQKPIDVPQLCQRIRAHFDTTK